MPEKNAEGWSLDLGTSNSGLARWDATTQKPELVVLPRLAREASSDDPLLAPRMIPSMLRVLRPATLADRLGARPWFARRFFIGTQAEIGRSALQTATTGEAPGLIRSFKSSLATAPLTTLARQGDAAYSARDAARLYVRELLAEVHRQHGQRVGAITVTVPVDAYETYRAEVALALRACGVDTVEFVDEPVAAAVGYGLGVDRERVVMVFDFGGGTLHLAAVRLTAHGAAAGRCTVLAKRGLPIGGQLVDRWLLDWAAAKLGFEFDPDTRDLDARMVLGVMLQEASRVKEALYAAPSQTLVIDAPDERQAFDARLRGAPRTVAVTRDDLVGVLTTRGLYSALGALHEDVVRDLAAVGVALDDVSDVLMVGGSSLLPGLFSFFEERHGRGRVRAFDPFEAVVLGASAIAAGRVAPADFVVHDYALVTHDLTTHQPRYEVVVPRGTSVPSQGAVWERKLVPTCALGVPESLFKLVIAELGADHTAATGIAFDATGVLRRVGQHGEHGPRLAVHLNEANPVLGALEPPHEPGDRTPRLSLAFAVNAQRWLVATVIDLKRKRTLVDAAPVVQLL